MPSPSDALYLLDTSSPVERGVLDQWIAARQDHGHVAAIQIDDPRALRASLDEALAGGRDPELRPLRVVWARSSTNEHRPFKLRDVVLLEDPRHPRARRQSRLLADDPASARVVDAEPATLSALVARWHTTTGASNLDPGEFVAYVRRAAHLALERAETKLIGPQHKVPQLVREEVGAQARFQSGLRRLAESSGRTIDEVTAEAHTYLDEMVATINRFGMDVTAEVARLYHRRGYQGRINIDQAQLDEVKRVAGQYPVVFLPSHRSYMDSTVLGVVLRDHGFPPNHRLGGANMAIGPIGAIGRRAGVIFIRRDFRDNDVYKFVLREYLGYLAEKRFSLEWNIEGTRSRTGKLGPPKLGLLAYVADAYLEGRCEDYRLIPVSILYDELIDVEDYSRYAKGATKSAESLSWFLRYVTRQRRHYAAGDIYVRFGEPVSLREMLGAPRTETGEPADGKRVDLQKVAFEVSARINRVTPITPSALITVILLGIEQAVTLGQLRGGLDYLLEEVRRRELPLATAELLDSDDGVVRAMEPLLRHGALTRFDDGDEPLYMITADQRVAASYYRNSILHHFLAASIAQAALVLAADPTVTDRVRAVHDEALRLRDLMKFEFYFADKDSFGREVADALEGRDPAWEQRVGSGPEAADDLVRSWRPLTAPVVLRSFIDAYLVTAVVLERKDGAPVEDQKALRAESMTLAGQFLLQRRIRGAESVSATLFDNAGKLAANYNLLTGDPDDLRTRRSQLRADLERTVAALATIEAIGIEQFERPAPVGGPQEG